MFVCTQRLGLSADLDRVMANYTVERRQEIVDSILLELVDNYNY